MEDKTRWQYCVEYHNTVGLFGSKGSAICAQAVYFLHSMMSSVSSVTSLRLSDVSNRVTYFQFPIQVCFFHVDLPGRAAAYNAYRFKQSDIGRCRKFG